MGEGAGKINAANYEHINLSFVRLKYVRQNQ